MYVNTMISAKMSAGQSSICLCSHLTREGTHDYIALEESQNHREGLKKKASYSLFVDKRLTPPPFLSNSAKLMIFTLRNFFIHLQ